MDINKPVSNPMLVGAMELVKAEDTPEHRNIFLTEVMKAVFLAPVVVTPIPVPDENGLFQLQPESKIQFPMLQAPDGKQFFMAFTDWEELRKWKNEDNQQTFGLRLIDFAEMMFQKNDRGEMNPAAGFVINPYGANMAMTKELVATMLAQRAPKPPKAPNS